MDLGYLLRTTLRLFRLAEDLHAEAHPGRLLAETPAVDRQLLKQRCARSFD